MNKDSQDSNRSAFAAFSSSLSDLGNLISKGCDALDLPFRSPPLALAARIVFFVFVSFTIVRSFTVGDSPAFQRPELARIFFWHFPCPMLATICLLQGTWWSLRYLRSDSLLFDIKALAVLELGFIFSLLTMATGIVFSQAEWGAWWQWDPRQTSFLLVLLIYGAYFILRGSYREPERKASFSSAYILAAILPALFLIYIFPYLPQIAQVSLHPTGSILSGQIKGGYAQVIWMTLIVTSLFSIWVFRLKVNAAQIEHDLYELS